MQISINIILFQMIWHGYPCELLNNEDNSYPATFDAIALYNESDTQFQQGTLYFITGQHLPSTLLRTKLVPFIIVSDNLPENIPFPVLWIESTDVLGAYAQLQEIFSALQCWLLQMQLDIVQGCDLQHILDLSQRWLLHGVCIWDATFSLLAYSQHVVSENYIFQQITTKGYMPSRITKAFIRHGSLRRGQQRKTATVHFPPNVANCIEIIRSLIVQDETHAVFTLFIDDGISPHQGYVELIELLCLALQKILIMRHNVNIQNSNDSKTLFISYLLNNPRSSQNELEERANSVDIPLQGNFLFSLIRFKAYSTSLINLALGQLQRKRNFSEVFIRDKEICFLNTNPPLSLQSQEFKQHLHEMISFLELHNAYSGTSSLFFSLAEISTAYTQAAAALDFNSQYGYPNRLTMYSQYYPQHLLFLAAQSYDSSIFFFQPLRSLIQYDQKHSSNNVELLKVYLENERNITNTAKVMHLHRNSVVYRIDKACALMHHCNLDDPGIRMQIHFSLTLLEMHSNQEKVLTTKSDT